MAKTALVTGAGRGIGAGIVEKLASEKWNVAVCDLKPVEDGNAQCAELAQKYGVEARYYRADISSSSDRENLVRSVVADFGALDALVNNAGVAPKVRADIAESNRTYALSPFRQEPFRVSAQSPVLP